MMHALNLGLIQQQGVSIWMRSYPSTMLPQRLVIWSVLAALLAVYVKYSGLQLLKSPEYIAAELTVGRYAGMQAQAPFVRLLGTSVLFIAASAWVFIIGQAVISAIRRYRYRPTVLPPLQPLSEEGRRQHSEAQQQHQGPTAGGSSSAAQRQSVTQAQTVLPPLQPLSEEGRRQQTEAQQQRQGSSTAGGSSSAAQRQQLPRPASDLDLDERRRRALDALQREHEEKTAAFREQQKQAEAERAIRRAQEAARQASAATAAADARAADTLLPPYWEQWDQAVLQQFGAPTGAAAVAGNNGATTAPLPAAAAAQRDEEERLLQEERLLREEQDLEFNESLAADRTRRMHQQRQQHQQQQLKALKAALQQQLPPEASVADAAAGGPVGDANAPGLTIRVRLPDGSSAVRRFAGAQGFDEVQDWVYSLAGMPLWAPGSWQLVSSFPKRQLQAASGIWAPGGSQQDLAGYIASISGAAGSAAGAAGSAAGAAGSCAAAAAVWSLTVRPLQGELITVQVQEDTLVLEVKQQVEQCTGISPAQQRLIFAGQVLSEDKTLQQYSITPEHMLQLASCTTGARRSSGGSGGGGGSGSGGGGTAPAAGDDAEGDGAGGEVSDGVLVVKDVQQLRCDVAHGASQLALYVVAVADAA